MDTIIGWLGSVATIFTIGFVFCKLVGIGNVVAWSWWAVFSPLYIFVAVLILFLILYWIWDAIF